MKQLIPLPVEFEKVDTALRERTMTGSEASQAIYAARLRLGPPWHWKSWKKARAEVLGTECKTCGAGTDAILYVQHTFRLPRVQKYIDKAKFEHSKKPAEQDYRPQLREEMYSIRDAVEPEMRECCPICSSLSIQYRKKAATWICNGTTSGKYCAHIFTEPAYKAALTSQQKKQIKAQKYQAWRNKATNRKNDWRRDAMLSWISDMRRYLSLQDTKTLCKRCAFLEDMTDLKPCLSCGFAYSNSESVCPNCSEDEV